MKRMLVVLAVLGLAASLSAQSLVELAKRERARRAALARHAVVIKSEDLRLVKKAPAVEVTRPEGEADFAAEDLEAAPNAEAAEPQHEVGLVASPPGSEEAAAAPGEAGSAAIDLPQVSGSLEEQLRVIDARVEELTTEMNSLRQQYESQNAMVPGYVIEQRMDETNQRLTQALQRQAEVRARLGGRAPAIRRESGGPGR
jgi:hypothetical protein